MKKIHQHTYQQNSKFIYLLWPASRSPRSTISISYLTLDESAATVGRFHLSEAYINKKDSAFQHYQGVGNYKIIPAANGDVKGIAVYNMVLDDQSRGYLYLLADSLTMVRIDEKGKPVQGDEALTLKKSDKKI